ncbi:MAG: HlyC/CorC family transporter [Acidobacteria bacterium]|nr:MAG: HlyC/CorC family transporter [Acidobacteriota bacterium]
MVSILVRTVAILALVSLNAFFAAAEYALLSVRRTRIEQLVAEGNRRARVVQTLLADTGLLISGTQFGMTLISLLMGWQGEAIMAEAIEQVVEGRLEHFTSLLVAHSIAVAFSFILITILLMVLGELVPKAIAYERADRVSLLVARPMLVFLELGRYPVRALDNMAEVILRALGQENPGQVHGSPHTPEEVKLIVAGFRKRGVLGEEQEEMIRSVFDLHQALVREIMTPWAKITCLPLTSDLKRLLQRVVEDRYTRVPIYDGPRDHIVGILNTKDLLRIAFDRMKQGTPLQEPFDLASILYKPTIVPETMTLDRMLEEARQRHSQIALVVNEFGTFVGLVTLEDVLEEVVGEIQDEYDREERAIRTAGDGVLIVEASENLRDLAEDYELVLPRDAGYTTLAGFVLARLGVIPIGGEVFYYDNRRYTVLEMDGRRVAKVKVEKLPSASSATSAAAGTADTATPARASKAP